MNIDPLIRDTLHTRAGAAPPGADLLTGVRARSRRRHRRRFAVVGTATAAAAAIAVAVVMAVPAMVREDPTAPTGPQLPAQPAGSETLVPPAYELPDVPFSLAGSPAGYDDPYYEFTTDYAGFTSPEPGNPIAFISVRVSGDDPGREWFDGLAHETAEEAIAVRGRDGVLRTGQSDETLGEGVKDNRITAVSWPEDTGQWVTVLGHNGPDPADAIRLAEELLEEPFPAQAPFSFELVPSGTEPTHAGPGRMTFEPAGSDPDGPGYLFVSVLTAGSATYIPCVDEDSVSGSDASDCPEPLREQLRVGDHDAELIEEPQFESKTLIVTLDGDLELWVTAKRKLELSREDLIQLATGVQVISDALPNP